jgi:hypothetical protein
MFRLELRSLVPLVAIPLLLATASSVHAQSKGKAKAKDPSVVATVSAVFSTAERELIVGWFHGHPVTGAKALPPGIRKNLARGKPLPPGIAKQVMPTGLLQTLPVRSGYETVRMGVDVLLVELATGIIHDVLMDVIR